MQNLPFLPAQGLAGGFQFSPIPVKRAQIQEVGVVIFVSLCVVVWDSVISGGWYWGGVGHRGVHSFAFVLVAWIFLLVLFHLGLGWVWLFSIVLFLCFVGRWLLFLLLVGFFLFFWVVVFAFVCSGLGFFLLFCCGHGCF